MPTFVLRCMIGSDNVVVMTDMPTKPNRRRAPVTITLSPRVVAMLDREAEETGNTRSRVVERIVRERFAPKTA